MNSSSSHDSSRSAESRFFYSADQKERLLEKLGRKTDEIWFLRQLVLSVSTGHTSPADALFMMGVDRDRADRLAAKIPTAEEVEAERERIWTHPRVNPDRPIVGSVVYYIQRNDLVKIGTTVRFARRMKALCVQPSDVLAVESGDSELENARHEQFKHLRHDGIGREMFRVEPDLRDHMLILRSEHPDPWAYGVSLTEAAA